MADAETVFGGRWKVVRRIDNGGQGTVYEVADTRGVPSREDLAQAIRAGVRDMSAVVQHMELEVEKFDKFVDAVRKAVLLPNAQRAALKKLHPLVDAINPETAHARMAKELQAMASVKHPSLVPILDQKLDEEWFVMELFDQGTLQQQLHAYKGQVLKSLVAVRPLVDAAAQLHAKKYVHRDIKPENIFAAGRGPVLGDCGLAIKLGDANRLTETYENVGTRLYQPPWSDGMRLEDVKPTFDVFSFGKVLWAMIAGRPAFSFWEIERKENDLRRMFPDNGDMRYIHRILVKCIVRDEEHCSLKDGAALLTEIDATIRALQVGSHLPADLRRGKCRFCGLGSYDNTDVLRPPRNDSAVFEDFRCDYCGHLESFRTDRASAEAWDR
jgi:serine/threonine protein kinase